MHFAMLDQQVGEVEIWFKTKVQVDEVPQLLRKFRTVMPKPFEYSLKGVITGSTIIQLEFNVDDANRVIDAFLLGDFELYRIPYLNWVFYHVRDFSFLTRPNTTSQYGSLDPNLRST